MFSLKKTTKKTLITWKNALGELTIFVKLESQDVSNSTFLFSQVTVLCYVSMIFDFNCKNKKNYQHAPEYLINIEKKPFISLFYRMLLYPTSMAV